MKKYLLFYVLFVFCSVINIKGQQSSFNKIYDVRGDQNPIIDCSYPLDGGCLTLNASYPKFYETTDYDVSSETYSPNGAFNSGTPLIANADDLYINKVVIPFNFCYFGITYNEVIVGSNGTISFDSKELGNTNYPNIQSTNPSVSLPLNSIFGVAHDLVFSKNNDSEIYYSVVGPNSCRQLVINFYKGRLVGCDQTSTSQIVLNECSSDIEIFIQDKPLPCSQAKFKNSLVGILNIDGTKGYSPPGRNTGVWEAHNEAWRFTAKGAEVLPQISWFDSNDQLIGTGNSVKVCPEKTETYKAKASFLLCGNNSFVLEDQSTVTFAANYPMAKNYTKTLCGATPLNVNLDDYLADLTTQNPSNFIFSFYNSFADAQTGTNPQPKNFQLTDNEVFYVRVQNPTDTGCYRTSTLTLNLIAKSLLSNRVEICDVNNDGVENNYLLSSLNFKLFNLPLSGTVHYFKTQTDAANNQNEIFSANISNNSQFFISYQTSDCSQVLGPITINFLPSPVINSPINFPYTTCDYLNDHTEPFDFALFLNALVSTNPNYSISYFSSFAGAFSGSGAQIKTIKEGQYSVFARVEEPGGCFSIATINLDITFNKVEANDKQVYICFDGTQDINVNLDDYSGDMLVDPLVGIKKTYFLKEADAEIDQNPISNLQTITDDGDFVSKIFYVKFIDSTGCYALKQLTINLVHVIIAKSQFDICDFLNDGTEKVTLSNLNAEIIGTQNATIEYFSTQTDAQNDTNPLTSFQLNGATQLFVKITYYGCSNIFEINLKLIPTPNIKTEISVVRNSVCDNNSDGQENFDLTSLQSQIYNDADSVTFSYYTSYDSTDNILSGPISTPTAFPVKGVSTVYAQVNFANGGCFSISIIDIKLNFLPTINLKNAALQLCNFDFNSSNIFNLNDAIPLLFDPKQNSVLLNNIDITYYKTEEDANEGNATKAISNNYNTSSSNINVYARFTSKNTLCYSVAPILLQSFLPPKGLQSSINDICDENLDGIYDVDLTAFTDNMVNQISADNLFSFYYSQGDAQSKINAIPNPKTFTIKVLPAKIWVRIENIPGCFDTTSVDLNPGVKVSLNNSGPLALNNVCDEGNDGIENVDLTQFQTKIFSGNGTFDYYPSFLDLNNDTNKITNAQNYLFNQKTGTNKIYVKVSTAGFCPQMVLINISLKKTPIFSLPDYYFCPESSVDIQPDFSGLDIASFQWEDPSGKIISTTNELLKINIEGTYKINVISNNGCTFSTQFQVKKYEVPEIKDLIINGNSATVIATGSKTIVYSIDGITYQTGNVFNNLPNGVITFYVKFADSDCAPITKKGLILKVNNAFSPNGDGMNDTWIIDNLDVFEGQKTNVKVFDRYQKLIFQQESNTKIEWDGKVEKRGISTDSYWYVITLPDGRVVDGWVLLKNRN